jgi:ABC-2 type transport system permease protein
MTADMMFALIRKDAVLYFSNRFFALITILGLVAYVGIYYALPDELDETLTFAVYGTDTAVDMLDPLAAEGLVLVPLGSVEELTTAVGNGDYQVGVHLPENFPAGMRQGETVPITLYFNANLPAEFRDIYIVMMQEISFMLSGQPLNIEVNEQLLGTDRAGNQIPYRDRMLPLFAVFLLLMETMGLASLIASEISSGTITALFVTPLRTSGLYLAKGSFGVALAFSQAALLLLVTGGLSTQPLLILTAAFLGALMVTGLGFLMATVTSDMMSVMGWGVLSMILLSLPAFGILIPGLATEWVKIIPSYYLVNIIYLGMNEPGWGWAQAWPDLLALLLFALFFLFSGAFLLQRRLQK